MVKKRSSRQDAIRWIVRNKSIRTQRSLVQELKKQGYNCTQATASRDIADMGLRKLPEGVYVLAEDLHLQRMISEFVSGVEGLDRFVIVRTQAGTAAGVAAAIDAANLPDMAGSVAGTDTALIICRSVEGRDGIVNLVEKLRNLEKK